MQGRVTFGQARRGPGQDVMPAAALCPFLCHVSCETADLKNPIIPPNAALSLLLHVFSEMSLIPGKERAKALGH